MKSMNDTADEPRRWTRRVWRAALRVLVPVTAVILATVAIPSNGHKAAAAEGGLIVHGTDFAFTVSDPSVTPGPVHIQFLNDSKDYVHELWVFPTDQPQLKELLAEKNAGKTIDEADFLTGLAGHVEDIDPGRSIAFDVTLQPGTYTLACFIKSAIGGKDIIHYDLGMKATLPVSTVPVVAPAPAPAPQPVVVKAPNTGSGPGTGNALATATALLVLAGAGVAAAGVTVRRAGRS